jgi:hypothetical protein
VAHGKKIVVNMIPQMFYNYNMNGIVTKNEIDQKTIIELPSNFRQYYLANNVFIVNGKQLQCALHSQFFLQLIYKFVMSNTL